MLIYHPAYDAYHCVFRMLLIADQVSNLEIEKARLLDFYLLFPGMVRTIRLPDNLQSLRADAKKAANVYRDPMSGIATFREMRDIQDAALKSVVASGFIDLERYESGFVTRSKVDIPMELKKKIHEALAQGGAVIDGILKGLAGIPLLGHDGLKHRTKLLEYRYDFA